MKPNCSCCGFSSTELLHFGFNGDVLCPDCFENAEKKLKELRK